MNQETAMTAGAPQVFFTAADKWRDQAPRRLPDVTLVAEAGFRLVARIDWKHYDLELMQVSDDAPAWEVVRKMEESSWYTVVPLPDSVSSPVWCSLHAVLQPEVAAICDKVELEFYDACNQQRMKLTPDAEARKQAVINRLKAFDGGLHRAVRTTTMQFLNDRMHHDFVKFCIDIDDIGRIRTLQKMTDLQHLAAKVAQLAQDEGAVLCDDPFEFLRGELNMIEAHCFEKSDAGTRLLQRYPVDQQAQVAARLREAYRHA